MRSMTGFGRGVARSEAWEVTVELKSVNHRFLDLAMRLPREEIFLEDMLRKTVSARLARGHVDVFLSVVPLSSESLVHVNAGTVQSLYQAAREIAKMTGLPMKLKVSELLGMSGVLETSVDEDATEALRALAETAAEQALDVLIAMGEKEGGKLKADLLAHLALAEELRNQVEALAPQVPVRYREKLEMRLKQLEVSEIDPQRLAQEVGLMADRCAIDEELARLRSHFEQMRALTDIQGECGKKIDFLIQEMNREANTIGSKASDKEITRLVVELKSEIEKMREQIQNVE
ncbi:MAG: YicC family protein [Clostridia bacterium]|nr:YicC family protein [Clostridia bacterium]